MQGGWGGGYFVSVTLPCFMSLPFSNICKNIVNVMLVFAQITSPFTRNKMADVQEFLAIFGEFLRFLCYFWLYFKMESLRKCKNNNHTFISVH